MNQFYFLVFDEHIYQNLLYNKCYYFSKNTIMNIIESSSLINMNINIDT